MQQQKNHEYNDEEISVSDILLFLKGHIKYIVYATLIGAIVWILCAKVLKISSISSLLGLIAVVISSIFINDGLNIGSNVPMYLIAFIILYKHIPNIVRLIKGEEKKVI